MTTLNSSFGLEHVPVPFMLRIGRRAWHWYLARYRELQQRNPWRPDLTEPYVVAIVELADQSGLRFVTNIVGTPPAEVHIGMPVRVRFEQIEDVWLPLFEKAA